MRIRFFASPVLIDGKVYISSDKGDVYVFEAAPKYHLLAKNSLGEPVFASPAVANGRLYVRGQQHLFCIGRPAEKRAGATP
jgi:outer membrane protein assembly factor BamB